MMLECKTYTYAEFSALFNTRDNQGIKRRLDRWGIKYSTAGRGTGLKYTIEEIPDPFVPFCILDLGFAPQTFFDKLNLFLYYLLNDEEFAGLPCEMMEQRIENDGYTLTRQTIENYLCQLDHQDLILRASGNYHYYFARRERLIDTTREEYSRAWREYWQDKEKGCPAGEAIMFMCMKYGGVARKQAIIEFNGIYNNTLNALNDMVCDRIEKKWVNSIIPNDTPLKYL